MALQANWDDIRFVLAVARAGTISLAARRLGISHATVGRRVSALEKALGTQLFERHPNGYQLTRQGERLVASASLMKAEAGRMIEGLGGADPSAIGTVRISALEGFCNFFLAKRIRELVRAHPYLTIELIAIQQITALSRRETDIAITLSPPGVGRFVSEELTRYNLFVYGSTSYLERHPPICRRADLLLHPFVGYIDDLIFTRGLDYLPELHPELRARVQNSSLHAQMAVTASGFGLCVLPAFVASMNPALVRVPCAELMLTRSYWMTSPEDVAESAAVRLTRRFLREEVLGAMKDFIPD